MDKMSGITLVLSILGALAWLPIIITPLVDFFRKSSAVLLDARILTNASGVSSNKKIEKKGTILILAINVFIRKTTIFAKKIKAIITLDNDTKLKTELLDFSSLASHNDDNTTSSFIVAEEQDFNISRTIHADIDNIKYIGFLVENATFATVDDVKKIELFFYYGKFFRKKVVINKSDYPRLNSSRLLEKIETTINDKEIINSIK